MGKDGVNAAFDLILKEMDKVAAERNPEITRKTELGNAMK